MLQTLEKNPPRNNGLVPQPGTGFGGHFEQYAASHHPAGKSEAALGYAGALPAALLAVEGSRQLSMPLVRAAPQPRQAWLFFSAGPPHYPFSSAPDSQVMQLQCLLQSTLGTGGNSCCSSSPSVTLRAGQSCRRVQGVGEKGIKDTSQPSPQPSICHIPRKGSCLPMASFQINY